MVDGLIAEQNIAASHAVVSQAKRIQDLRQVISVFSRHISKTIILNLFLIYTNIDILSYIEMLSLKKYFSFNFLKVNKFIFQLVMQWLSI